MLRPHHVILLVSLLADGGTAPTSSVAEGLDAGIAHPPSSIQGTDAGTVAPKPKDSNSVPWPETELEPLATLDGPAILAAHTVLQQVMQRFPEGSAKSCAFSPRSLELVVGYEAGWYFVRVNRRVDKCPEFGPGVVLELDWFELYAVSPEGRVERYPYAP